MTPKQPWTRPEATPLTNTGSTSDSPDVAARNGLSQAIN